MPTPKSTDPLVHGTRRGYQFFKCRCEPCVEDNRKYLREWRAKRREDFDMLNPKYTHGKVHTYAAGCRCASCKAAKAASCRYQLYGITIEQTKNLLKKQNYICPVCDGPLENNYVVDHDHNTKAIRGVLHMSCNGYLGKFGDTLESIQAYEKDIKYKSNILDYLRSNTTESI